MASVATAGTLVPRPGVSDLDDATRAPRRPRVLLFVAAVALAGLGVRLWLAATTYGTDDVTTFELFARSIRHTGPWRIYDVDFASPYLYNHGPLTSWWLTLIARAPDAWFPFLLRVPACLADLGSTFLVFALVRRLRGQRQALGAAVVFALAPVTVVIAGFHGNVDPVFLALVLLSVWCLCDGRRAVWAGVALGLAISIKVVPIVVVPVLLHLALRRGRRHGIAFVAGGAAVFVLLWVPAMVTAPSGFVHHVLGYSGISVRQWGLSQAAVWLGLSPTGVVRAGDWLGLVAVAAAAATPFVLRRLRPDTDSVVLALLPLCAFLFVSPAFSMQYLVWAAAAALVCVPLATAGPYVALSSLYVLLVYSGWNSAPPWRWDVATSFAVSDALLVFMALTWLALGLVCKRALVPSGPRFPAAPVLHPRPARLAIPAGGNPHV